MEKKDNLMTFRDMINGKDANVLEESERSTNEELQELISMFNKNVFSVPIISEIINSLDHYIMVLNNKREIIFGNKSILKVIGKTHEEIIGFRFGEIIGCHNAYQSHVGCGNSEKCGSCFAFNSISEAIEGKNVTAEVPILRYDGKPLIFKLVTAQLKLLNETFLILSLNDISDKKNKELIERIFFHDIKNSIGALTGFSELLSELISDNEEVNHIVDQIKIISKTIVAEIETQHQIVKASDSTVIAKRESFSINEFLEERFLIYKGFDSLKTKQLIFKNELKKDIILKTDKETLNRVLTNLVKNAGEASKDEEEIIVSCESQDKNNITISVKNNAIIPKEIRDHIFVKHYSTKGKNRGIGTFSIKYLTENVLKGKVSFISNEIVKTIFSIEIPTSL